MRHESRSSIRTWQDGEVFQIAVAGEFDLDDEEALRAALRACAAPATVIDLSALTFADSTLLNCLLEARRHHERAGRRLVLAGPLHSAPERLLTLTGTLDFFTLAASREEALALART
jgi:anti-anti-sigma factor